MSVQTYTAIVIKKATHDDKGHEKTKAEVLGEIPTFIANNDCQAKAIVIGQIHADEKLAVVFENILDYEVRLQAQQGHVSVFG